MKEAFAITSLVLSIAANIPYIRETLSGKVKPERVSWLLWTLLGATYFTSALLEDGAVYFTFGELIGPVVILVLSIKYGVGGRSTFDKYSLAVALAAFAVLLATENVLLGLAMALLVDIIGAVLTIRKLRLDPASESRNFWGVAAVSSIFALLALETFTAETLAFPVYVLILSTIIFSMSNPAKEKHLKQLEEL